MGQNAKSLYDRRSEQDRRSVEIDTSKDRRTLSDRRKTEGLELSTNALDDDEFEEVFKQFQKADPETGITEPEKISKSLDIIDYQVLYRAGVECAYITLLKTDENSSEPTLYAFMEEQENADSQLEGAPMHVQNIFGKDAYQSYIEQGWNDISKTENIFPWALKSWLAQNMKQDEIKSR